MCACLVACVFEGLEQTMVTHTTAQVHWMGCIFYFVARAEGKTPNSWIGGADGRFERNDGWVE